MIGNTAAEIPPDEHQPEAAAAPVVQRHPELTDEQARVRDQVLADFGKRKVPEVTLGGYAGTGKTTLIRALLAALPGWAVCAFTGKAANVLRRKGVSASTIHSLIYAPAEDDFGRTVWRRKDSLYCNGIIVDEASMVSEQLYADLMSFRLPILWVGDHGQLEPVGSTFNLMAQPQYRLETIHRNAGAIAQFAEALRHQGLDAPRPESDEVTFLWADALTVRRMTEVDQVCVGMNATRVKANAAIRGALGRTGVVEVGDRVMCLRNNRELGLFNGLQAVVTRLRPKDRFDLQADGRVWSDVPFEPSQFGQESAPVYRRGQVAMPFDYAYAATCHKLQGDEADTVLVIVQQVGRCDMRRWAYTAATRARRHLVWVTR